MDQYKHLLVFSEDKFEKINTAKKESFSVSENIILSEEEKSILRIHSKFAMVEDLSSVKFEIEKKLSYAKIRMEIRNEEEKGKIKKKEAPYLEVVPEKIMEEKQLREK